MARRILVSFPLIAAVLSAGTLNGTAALVAIVQASPNVEKAPEARANPFTTMPGAAAKAPAAKPPQLLTEGNPASAVRVVAYEDLQCPDCATYRRMMDEKLLPAYQDGVARGVSKTPTVFGNGRPFVETFTVEEIIKAIEAELKTLASDLGGSV